MDPAPEGTMKRLLILGFLLSMFSLWGNGLVDYTLRNRLQYDPPALTDYTSEIHPDILSAEAVAYSPSCFGVALSTPLHNRSLRNMRVVFASFEPEHNYVTSLATIRWQPRYNSGTADWGIDWIDHSSPTNSLDLTATRAGLDAAYTNENGFIREARFYAASTSVKQKSDRTNTDRTPFDGEFRVRMSTLNAELRALQYDQSEGGEGQLSLRDLPGLDEIGLWYGANEEHSSPSGIITWRAELRYNLYLKFGNEPGVEALSVYDRLRDCPWSNAEIKTLPVVRPLNAFAGFEYQGLLTLGAFARVQRDLDAGYAIRDNAGLYLPMTTDLTREILDITTGYQYGLVAMENRLRLQSVEAEDESFDRLPFEAALENAFTLAVTNNGWVASLGMTYLGNRRDERDLAMNDVLLFDLVIERQLASDFSVYGSVHNLFNREYRAYSLAPVEKVSFGGGIRWSF
jgi:hypothetical protein